MQYSLQTALIEITNRCNMRCPFCFSGSGLARTNELSLDEWIRVLQDLRRLGCKRVGVVGGEFMLREDWAEICFQIVSQKMLLSLLTNGLALTSDMVGRLGELGVSGVGVSVDGANAESYCRMRGTDGYKKAIEAIEMLKGNRKIPFVTAVTTFSAKNIDDFDAFVDLFVDSGVTWQIQLMQRGGLRFSDDYLLSREQFAWLLGKVKDTVHGYDRSRLPIVFGGNLGHFPLMADLMSLSSSCGQACQGAIRYLGIRSNGDVLPCLSLGDDFVEGNVRTCSVYDLWNSETSFRLFREKSTKLKGACASCDKGSECRAGCVAIALTYSKSMECNPLCIRQIEREQILREIVED